MSTPSIYLPASGAKRWTSCTASPLLILQNHHRIVRVESEYAKEGVIAHEFAAMALLMGYTCVPDDPEMERHINAWAEWIASMREPDDQMLVEERLPLWYMPHRNGYIDCGLTNPRRTVVADFKYGQGVAVYAEGNEQLSIYGRTTIECLGGRDAFSPDHEIIIAVFQPRARGKAISEWRLTLDELFAFTDGIADTAHKIQRASALDELEFKPDPNNKDICGWCDAAPFCKALERHTLGEDDFSILGDDEPELPDVSVLSPEELSALLNRSDRVARVLKWLDTLKDYAKAALHAGKANLIPGWKLVNGKAGHRFWTDEKAADTLLANYLPATQRKTAPKLVSPAQAEELLKGVETSTAFKTRWNKIVSQKTGGLVLAPADDERESATIQAELEFENLDEEDYHSLL